MTIELSVADINSYLAETGWARQPGDWRGATIWVHEGDHEILVPSQDGFGDGPRRIREIIALLARLERRAGESIATDIASPTADVQWYRAPAAAMGEQLGLTTAVAALNSAQEVLSAAARAAFSGPRPVFDGTAPKEVRDLLARVQVGPIVPFDDSLTVRVPVKRDEGGDSPLARRALLLLQRAVQLLLEATDAAGRTGDLRAFDEIVQNGVSANLCAALARFAGPGSGTEFEVGFRWARALPAATPPSTAVFEAEAGALLRRVAHRLRRLRQESASVTGLIGTLFDNGGQDRFRVQVHGDVTHEEGRARGSLWVRLPDEPAYDLAVEAHRARRLVRADGTLRNVNGRLELTAVSFTRLAEDTAEEA